MAGEFYEVTGLRINIWGLSRSCGVEWWSFPCGLGGSSANQAGEGEATPTPWDQTELYWFPVGYTQSSTERPATRPQVDGQICGAIGVQERNGTHHGDMFLEEKQTAWAMGWEAEDPICAERFTARPDWSAKRNRICLENRLYRCWQQSVSARMGQHVLPSRNVQANVRTCRSSSKLSIERPWELVVRTEGGRKEG